jgi:hypothetical protein
VLVSASRMIPLEFPAQGAILVGGTGNDDVWMFHRRRGHDTSSHAQADQAQSQWQRLRVSHRYDLPFG